MRADDAVRMAVMLPKNQTFREWVTTFTTDTETVSEEQAVRFIRLVCEIESRTELETNPDAVSRFSTILRRNYMAWRDDPRRAR